MTTRSMNAAMATALGNQQQGVFWLFQLEFSGGTGRYTTAAYDVTWNSQTWTALGGHLSVDFVQESPDKRQGVNVILDGVDQTIVDDLLGENFIGRNATLYYGLFGTDGAIVVDPIQFGPYFMNSHFVIEHNQSDDGTGTVTIRSRLTSRMAPVDRIRGIVTNLRSHQKHYSGDLFFEHIPNIVGKRVIWGGQAVSTGSGGTGGTGVEGGGIEDEKEDTDILL